MRLKFYLLFGLLLLFFSIFCFSNSQGTTYKIVDSTGNWGFPSPYGMYPRGPGYIRMSLIFDTLVWKDQKGWIPALATQWKFLENETAYLFNLGKNITWHDGKPFTADDVIFTFEYLKRHPWPWVNPDIIKRTEKINSFSLKIYLKHPSANFITSIAGVLPILPRHIWEKVTRPEEYQEKKALVGTGPFQLIDYNKAQGTYLYKAYDHYYQGKPFVSKIIFMKASPEASPVMLNKGIVNISPLPGELVKKFKDSGFSVIEQPASWVVKLHFNHQRPPLNSPAFRHAIAYALDRDKITKIISRGFATPGNPGMIPPDDSYWYHPGVEQFPYQPQKAGSILESLGYTKGKDGYYYKDQQILQLQLLLSIGSRTEFGRLGEFIQNEFKKIGIKIDLMSIEAKTLDTKIKNWKFQLAISGHGGLGSDPSILQKTITHIGINSARFFQNPKLMKLLQLQSLQVNKEDRRKTIFQIQEIIARELPFLCLYYPKSFWAYDNRVSVFYTPGGLAAGIPSPLNKMVFIR